MARDQKYGEVTAEHGNRIHGAPGVPLNESDEPIFIIRAQDVVGPAAVRAYGQLAEEFGASEEHVASVFHAADAMQDWQNENADLVKVPD